MLKTKAKALTLGTVLTLTLGLGLAQAQETIKLGLSVPLAGAGAVWGKGSEFMCKKAAEEINRAGGVKGDKTYNFEGLKVFVDQASLLYLDGAEVDYVESMEGSGFKFNNPNVKSTCGCGSSFSA